MSRLTGFVFVCVLLPGAGRCDDALQVYLRANGRPPVDYVVSILRRIGS